MLALARRPKFRELVDNDTANMVGLSKVAMPAVLLRGKVLEAQNRKPEIESLLDSIVTETASIELAQEIEVLATQKSLQAVRQNALEKQAALTTDPVTRLQLRYALIRVHEERKVFQSAEKMVALLYRENPKVLGVVRSTVDFYWRAGKESFVVEEWLTEIKDNGIH